MPINSKEDPQRMRLLSCHKCGENYVVTQIKETPRFCVLCGHSLEKISKEVEAALFAPIRSVGGVPPDASSILFTLYNYQITKKIGQGGMGEVFIAFDLASGRNIALKRIREDIPKTPRIDERFLREAYITCQLCHPSIIPIYSIHKEGSSSFYTMPYVDGETLKEKLRKIRNEEKEGSLEHSTASILKLIRLFIQVCHAISYAHMKGIIHKDIKPENILIGKFGEVFVHDWGIAQLIDEVKDAKRRLSGTFSYLPPEQALGAPDSIQNDVFALGVVLYQILTLKMPFQRKTQKEFKELAKEMAAPHPQKHSPFRDIPEPLSEIALKALHPDPQMRYNSVQTIIDDLEAFAEGTGQFHPTCNLNPAAPENWEFRENILLFEHAALTRDMEGAEWVFLMISSHRFGQNIRQNIRGRLQEGSLGIGFLLFAEAVEEGKNPFQGLGFFLSTITGKSGLLRSAVEIMELRDFILPTEKDFELVIEQSSDKIKLYVDGKEIFTFVHHLPQRGNRIGFFAKELGYRIDEWTLYEAFPSVMVNCLAIPDAFLAHRDYSKAFSEYQKIAQSFPGHTEEREAIFRAGITLLEEAKQTTEIQKGHDLFAKSLTEFKKLRKTPASPLEHLGRALVWRTIGDLDEEVTCFGRALRKKSHHPLRDRIEEELLFRLTEASLYERKEAYSLLHLVVEEAPRLLERDSLKSLVKSLEKHAEIPYFLTPLSPISESVKSLELFLLFWLGRASTIRQFLNRWKDEEPKVRKSPYFALEELGVKTALEETFPLEHERRALILKLRKWNEWKRWDEVIEDLAKYAPRPKDLSLLYIEALLFQGKYKLAEKEFSHFSPEEITSDSSLLPFLYGCFLTATESEEVAHTNFSGLMDSNYPRSWNLGRSAILEKLPTRWFSTAFLWEKKELTRQMALYFSAQGDLQKRDESLERLATMVPVE